jgi:hypothetical protein
MKKLILMLSIVIATVACNNNRNVSELRLNSDKIDDVKSKFGQADSIAKVVLFGNTAELWYYKKDSIACIFTNDILVKIRTPESNRAEYKKMEEEEKAKMDSIFNEASKSIDAELNKK